MKKSETSNKSLTFSEVSSSVSNNSASSVSSESTSSSISPSEDTKNNDDSNDVEDKNMDPIKVNDQVTSDLKHEVDKSKFFEELRHQITIDINMLKVNSMEENDSSITYSAFCALIFKIKTLLNFISISDSSRTINYFIALLSVHDFDLAENAIRKLKC